MNWTIEERANSGNCIQNNRCITKSPLTVRSKREKKVEEVRKKSLIVHRMRRVIFVKLTKYTAETPEPYLNMVNAMEMKNIHWKESQQLWRQHGTNHERFFMINEHKTFPNNIWHDAIVLTRRHISNCSWTCVSFSFVRLTPNTRTTQPRFVVIVCCVINSNIILVISSLNTKSVMSSPPLKSSPQWNFIFGARVQFKNNGSPFFGRVLFLLKCKYWFGKIFFRVIEQLSPKNKVCRKYVFKCWRTREEWG